MIALNVGAHQQMDVGDMAADLRYRRVLLKLSGEALMGSREGGLDPEFVAHIAE